MNSDTLPLRDIHLPDAVSWWPLAVGWWIVLLLIVLTVVALVLVQRRPHKPSRIVRAALAAHWRGWQRDKDSRALVIGLSQTLRRMAIATDGREARAGLTGSAWRELLNQPMQGAPFDTHPGVLLTDSMYRRNAPTLSETDAATLLALCRERAQLFARPVAVVVDDQATTR